jgi:signal peptidase I
MNNALEGEITPQDTEKGSFIKVFFITFVIALFVRIFIAQPFIVNGASMEPTFESGEYVIVDEISYRFREPVRGEVVIFKYPKNPSKFFIKRIVGLPGETVEVKNNSIFITDKGGVLVNLEGEYASLPADGTMKVTLAEDEYFVLGDNRPVSSDSRRWGPLPEDLIVGRAFVRFLPVTRIELLPGNP